MAIRDAPRRILKLDRIYKRQGGVASYVLARLKAGDRVEEIARDLSTALGEEISTQSVYRWTKRWRREQQEATA